MTKSLPTLIRAHWPWITLVVAGSVQVSGCGGKGASKASESGDSGTDTGTSSGSDAASNPDSTAPPADVESGTVPDDSGADGGSNAEAGGRVDDSGTEAGPDGGTIAPSVTTLASMVLAFDDEFSGPANSQPDTTKWQFSFTGSNMIDYGGGELIDISLPHLDGSGHCVLPGQYNGGGVTDPANYSGGCIITKGGQAGTGYAVVPTSTNRAYMEWRAQLPAPGAGVWPALWAISNGDPYTEVDIMEQGTGIGPTPPFDAYFTYWTGPNYNTLTKVAGLSYHAAGSPSLAADYHVYSSLWTTTDVTWYIDGVQAGTAAIPTTNQGPVAPIANFQVGKGGGGTPDGTGWPRYFTIDYVRVFRDQ